MRRGSDPPLWRHWGHPQRISTSTSRSRCSRPSCSRCDPPDSYRSEGRLVTEHALLDDTGDSQGTPATWYRGLQPIQKPKDGRPIDGAKACRVTLVPSPFEASLNPEFRSQRAAVESRISELRTRKASMSAADYDRDLEVLLLELATLYKSLEKSSR